MTDRQLFEHVATAHPGDVVIIRCTDLLLELPAEERSEAFASMQQDIDDWNVARREHGDPAVEVILLPPAVDAEIKRR